MAYKKNFESSKNFEIEDDFSINLSAVKKQSKIFGVMNGFIKKSNSTPTKPG